MPIRFQPNPGAAIINLAALTDPIITLDALIGSTPDLFAVRGADGWEQRAIVGSDLPNPSTTTLGGVFALPESASHVMTGIDSSGNPQRDATTGTGDVVRAAGAAVSGNWTMSGTLTITTASSVAIAIGRQGAVAPAFMIDASAASSATGIIISALAAGNGTRLTASSSGPNEAFIIDAKGTGTIDLGVNSTGNIELWRDTNIMPGRLINLFGSGSGFTALQAAAAASGTLTLPAATDTLVGKATTDTLTNKTYNTQGTGNTFTLNGAAFGTQAQALAALGNPLLIAGVAVDFNAVGDNAITIVLPTGVTRYRIQGIITINNGTTASLTTAQFGVFTDSGGAGTAIVASGTALTTITSNAAGTNTSLLVSGSAVTAWFTDTSLFYRVTQAQGAAASGFAYIQYQPLPG